MKIKRIILTFSVLIFSLVALPGIASAYDPLGSVTCGQDRSNSAVCSDRGKSSNPITGSNGAIVKAAHIIGIIAGVVAVIMLIVAGIKYVTSGGDSQKTSSAKNTIVYALIGIIVIVLSETIITFVVSRT